MKLKVELKNQNETKFKSWRMCLTVLTPITMGRSITRSSLLLPWKKELIYRKKNCIRHLSFLIKKKMAWLPLRS